MIEWVKTISTPYGDGERMSLVSFSPMTAAFYKRTTHKRNPVTAECEQWVVFMAEMKKSFFKQCRNRRSWGYGTRTRHTLGLFPGRPRWVFVPCFLSFFLSFHIEETINLSWKSVSQTGAEEQWRLCFWPINESRVSRRKCLLLPPHSISCCKQGHKCCWLAA